MSYTLTLNDKQAKMLCRACEFYARIRMGQWNRICEETLEWDSGDFNRCLEDRDKVEKLLMEARGITWPYLGNHEGASWGVGKFKDADMVWEIYATVRHAMAWNEHPEGGWTVDFSQPMSFSGEEIPKCVVVKDKQRKSKEKK